MGRNWKRAQPQGPAPRQFLTRQRFFSWIGRNRRLAKDFEATIPLSTRLPLRRINHAARASDRSCFMTFETYSQCEPPERLFSIHFVSFLGGIVRTSNGMSLGQSSLDLAERVFM